MPSPTDMDNNDAGPTIVGGSRAIGGGSGSVSVELLRHADVPVLVIPPTAVHDLQEA